MVKSIGCSRRRFGFNPRCPHGGSQLSITPGLGALTTSFDLCRNCTHVHRHTCSQSSLTHIKQKQIFKTKKEAIKAVSLVEGVLVRGQATRAFSQQPCPKRYTKVTLFTIVALALKCMGFIPMWDSPMSHFSLIPRTSYSTFFLVLNAMS